MGKEELNFLTLAEVIEIHKDQIERYGGHPGLRDYDLLCSAIAMPEASFGGKYLHLDIFEMAAAYVFYICQDHPFIDGNKRTGLACGLVFLEINGITIIDDVGILYETVMSVASGKLKKVDLAKTFRKLYQITGFV
ncbi:death on curing protein [Desulfotomaculum arcticum]|uniref:Death on curing protein n=1 Tax=Desulfotruncus arcticus DSM 17038 TaxID=1121424 RepID=A0A1I2UTA6_9FIRM|nr:type II toxin-antitoxin system death-on-curing family toxin [Desulfotruncus arcticus]SFG78196.1 death on curing protein [Desulfotomaculum arcticum] [Desulfotruncus arcticus DSM 17038]